MTNIEEGSTSTVEPPPFEATNMVELFSSRDGKMTHVSVYPSRADISRLFKFPLKVGQNQVMISGLPTTLDDHSLRAEGSGAAMIQDVTISLVAATAAQMRPVGGPLAPQAVPLSPQSGVFEEQKEHIQCAIKRTEKAIDALATYLSTWTIGTVSADELESIIGRYDETTAKLDGKLVQLKKELAQLEQDTAAKDKALGGPNQPSKTVTVGIFGKIEGEAELFIHYAVTNAGWAPLYDLRVDTDAKEKCVKLVYKASIKQTTGEAWEDVPLTLETSLPMFDVYLPSLTPWKLSFEEHIVAPRINPPMPCMRSAKLIQHTVAKVHHDPENAGVVATFEIATLKTIPSDGAIHNVTVTELELDGELSWVSVPSIDARMHRMANIQNASDYPLLRGMASVYINESFTARSMIPYVSPQERFSCGLGIDPSIRLVYHPREKKRSQTGFYSKSSNHVFTQRISLNNTKACAVENVKIMDHIPISEDSSINVKLLSPVLPFPDPILDKKSDMSKSVQVSKGVVVQWEKDNNEDVDVEKLGLDGRLSWICTIPAQGRLNLVLSWEIAAPADKAVVGL